MNNPTLILSIGGGIALVLLIVGIVISIRSERAAVEERMGRYLDPIEQEHMEAIKRTPLTDWLNKSVEKSSYGNKIAQNLARADLKIKPGEYIALMLIAAFGVGVVLWFIGGRNIIAGVIGAVIGLFLPNFYVKRQQGKRLIRFNDQLADMLNLMVNGLRAGFSTVQAMEAISKELPPPISDEFLRVVQEMQLGVPMERALDNLLARIPSDDLDLVITAINVQREVGGNLAEILDTISHTIRERVRIKGEIRVLTTQTMYSGRFLSMMPVIVLAILYLLNRDYMMTFFIPENRLCGSIALGVGATLIVIGYLVMNKIADIEV
ncbi:MAG: type II secretion system F family protein [Anaerolinea sp.]|nr:type II secretion system F family protein [Anaerolinea sp.]